MAPATPVECNPGRYCPPNRCWVGSQQQRRAEPRRAALANTHPRRCALKSPKPFRLGAKTTRSSTTSREACARCRPRKLPVSPKYVPERPAGCACTTLTAVLLCQCAAQVILRTRWGSAGVPNVHPPRWSTLDSDVSAAMARRARLFVQHMQTGADFLTAEPPGSAAGVKRALRRARRLQMFDYGPRFLAHIVADKIVCAQTIDGQNGEYVDRSRGWPESGAAKRRRIRNSPPRSQIYKE